MYLPGHPAKERMRTLRLVHHSKPCVLNRVTQISVFLFAFDQRLQGGATLQSGRALPVGSRPRHQTRSQPGPTQPRPEGPTARSLAAEGPGRGVGVGSRLSDCPAWKDWSPHSHAAVLVWALPKNAVWLLLPKETLERRRSAIPCLLPSPPPPRRSPSSHPSPSSAEGQLWPRSAGCLCGCFPGRKKRCLQISLSAGFPVPERRRFPGTTATPVIPSWGCGWCVRAG